MNASVSARWLAALGAAAWVGVGCAAAPKTPIGYDVDALPALSGAPEAPHAERPREVPDDVVARAAGPVQVRRLSDGATLSGQPLTRELLEYEAICAGEQHDSAAQHYGELWLLEHLARRAPTLGLELGVGFEMWARKYQKVLNSFSKGAIDADDLRAKTDYDRRWGFPFAYYAPILERALSFGVPLVALNAPGELTHKIAEGGLDALNRRENRELPELDLNDAAHRADFEQRMKQHPGMAPEDVDNFYAAQVVWDETMASNVSRWIDIHAPARRLLILAGQAHCQRTAIPKRIERRSGGRVAAVLLATELPDGKASEGYDYALVVTSGGEDDHSSE